MFNKLNLFSLLILFPAICVSSELNWAGSYLGLGIGTTRTNSQLDYSHAPTSACDPVANITSWFGNNSPSCAGDYATYSNSFRSSNNKMDASFQIGHSWQAGNIVYGIVGEYRQGEATSYSSTPWRAQFFDTLTVKNSIDGGIPSIRLIGGVSMGSFMPFITGGISMAKIKTQYIQQGAEYADLFVPVIREKNQSRFGPSLGAGFRYQVDENYLLSMEFIYSSFKSDGISSPYSSALNAANTVTFYPPTSASSRITQSNLQLLLMRRF